MDADVRWAGWVEPALLEGLWSLTSGFVFPSLYEGFGLPVLEAMARGVAVACSNASSLPEVAGGAALLFDPSDTARSRRRCAGCWPAAPRSTRCAQAGRARAAQFSWERTARGYACGLRARRLGRVGGEDRLERALEREPLRVRRKPLARALAHRRAGAVHGDDRGGHRLRAAVAAITPLTPSSISSTAALSGSRTTMLGMPHWAASTTISP